MKKGQSKVLYSKRLNNEKGQASMEFLMVYGWAILAAVVAIGVLAYYGVFTPGKSLPSLCFVEAPLGCSEFEVAVDSVRLFLINGAGTAINVNSVSLPGTPTCTSAISGDTFNNPISDGDKFEVVIDCDPPLGDSGDKFDGKLEVLYTLAGKQIEQKASGDIKTDIRSSLSGGPSCTPTENPETSCLDFLDNDCNGYIDIADENCPSICIPTENPEVTCTGGIDEDCDGDIDGADSDCSPSSCIDGDNDDYNTTSGGDCGTLANIDCEDADPLEFPGQTWYADADSDLYSSGSSLTQCLRPTGYNVTIELTAISGDC